MPISITTPLTDDVLEQMKAGEQVYITGVMYTARDAAHRRMVEALSKGEALPVDLKGQIIYYVGPTPPKPGQIIGSAGPTTAMRMDPFTPALLEIGLKGAIGKGGRSPAVRDALKRHRAVYFGAIGGAGVLIARTIKAVEIVAYEDLGTEAMRRIMVEEFPCIVVNDIFGNDLLEQGRVQWEQKATAQASE